ncbi:MAG: FliH/SctL family protein [Planctomycetota bacterium]
MSPEPIRLGPAHPGIRAVHLVDLAGRDSLDAIAERAWSRARAAGIAHGRSRALEREAGVLAAAAERLDRRDEELAAELAHSAVELGVAIARQLVLAEVNRGGHDIEKIVRETLAAASAGRGRCTIHVHPEDFESLRGVPFRSGTAVQADIGVARGDVHVETSMGLMVREIEAALDSIAERLREELR